MSEEITQEDLIAAIRAAHEASADAGEDSGGITRPELQAAFGWGKERALATCKRLIAEGVLAPAKLRRVDLWGDVNTVKGYRLREGANHDSTD